MKYIDSAVRQAGTAFHLLALAAIVAVGFAIAASPAHACYGCTDNPGGGGTTTSTVGISGIAEFTRLGDSFAGGLGDRAGAVVRQYGTTSSFTIGGLDAATSGCTGGCGSTTGTIATGGRAIEEGAGRGWARSAGTGERTAESVGNGMSRTTGAMAIRTDTPRR